MKIDEKTLSILGAPKEGFEWVEKSWPGGYVHSGDVALDATGARWVNDGGDAPLMRGVAYGSGRYYRQVPIEPEPEVIWGPVEFEGYELRLMANGQVQERCSDDVEFGIITGSSICKLAPDYATQHKELKALKKKLGEIKKEAQGCYGPEHFRDLGQHYNARLIELARNLEVE